ncbi:VOC family protein [Brevibacterium aurantiacum]|uniref:VOC family protein n=1 Tax=Brevibacterium aurantiacum TaxID=273384 RepID=A0A556CKF8_BREAU|nr:VOC family protein [Brevibacterium aurantiacum]TSI17922.1 VOC family protein [Brevibacterium aurantiacum]
MDSHRIGTIVSADLTVPEAGPLRDFYTDVIGWTVEEWDMEGYSDYFLKTADGADYVGGICHRRGANASLPPVWLVYINVADVAVSAQRCTALGGKVLVHNDQFAVIEDPAGSILAITHVDS